jgi:2-oxoglutarate ferredoxin oxidoreductase subunit beta
VELPVLPAAFALGAAARFVARSIDTTQAHLVDVLKRAHEHRGASFVEIFQNCVVFNDRTHAAFTDRVQAADNQILVEHGKPLLFGKNRDKGLVLACGALEFEVVTLGVDGVTEDDILVHDETNRSLAMMLAYMRPPNLPMALGVLYCSPRPSYERDVRQQADEVGAKAVKETDLAALVGGGRTWTVKNDE